MIEGNGQFVPKIVRGGKQSPFLNKLSNILKLFQEKLNKQWGRLLFLLVVLYYPLLFSYESWGFVYTLYVGVAQFVLAYTTVLILSLIPYRKVNTVVFIVVSILTIAHSVLMLTCQVATHDPLSKDIIGAILATNPSETKEFIDSYLTPQVVVCCLGLAVSLILLAFLLKKVRVNVPKIICSISLAFYVVCFSLFVHNKAVVNETVVGFFCIVEDQLQKPQIKLSKTSPKLTVKQQNQPPLIIWVVGEALTNHHCSLYGYDKLTNPLLEKRLERGDIFRFTNVLSAGTGTLESFQRMMSTYEKRFGDRVKWNECITFPDVARVAGYHTTWLSNQSKSGLYDNVVSQYAELCDTNVFIGNKYSGLQRLSYDGELLPVLKKMLRNTSGKNVFVVHLMGCHQSFNRRYPAAFQYFKPEDYANRPVNQREKVAAYDNAVRYNDYVINSLYDLVSGRDAIVVYAPDHGLDIYESRPDFAGHVHDTNPIGIKAARDIPFLIYMTPQFKKRHSDWVKRVKLNLDRKFDTENMIYLMMDLMNCDFTTPIVAKKSLLRL